MVMVVAEFARIQIAWVLRVSEFWRISLPTGSRSRGNSSLRSISGSDKPAIATAGGSNYASWGGTAAAEATEGSRLISAGRITL
jgi:hypothetical protein